MNSSSGGTEKLPHLRSETATSTSSKLAIANAIPKTIEPGEARVERDPTTGKILRVIHDEGRRDNPLNDPLNDVEDEVEDGRRGVGEGEGEGEGNANSVVRELERQAGMGREKKKRKQSEREREWIERLVGRWGEEFGKMARDRRLNPMQQTEADIRRRVGKWREDGGMVAGA